MYYIIYIYIFIIYNILYIYTIKPTSKRSIESYPYMDKII